MASIKADLRHRVGEDTVINLAALARLQQILKFYNHWIPRCSPLGRERLDQDVVDAFGELRARIKEGACSVN